MTIATDSSQHIIYLSAGDDRPEAETGAEDGSDLLNEKLDDDVLREVFLYFPAQAHWKLLHEHDDSTWLSITHVCRRWRSLSLSTPLIWRDIITSPSFWTPICLERAQSAPIYIKLYWSTFLLRHNPSDELVASMLRHLDHTSVISLESVPAPSFNRFATLLQEPASRLEELRIQAQTAQGLQPLTIPDDVFGGHAPCLREVRLEGLALRFKWTNPIFSSGLATLMLCELSERVCGAELFAVLRRMTALKHLRLEQVLHLVPVTVTTAPTPPPLNERITLPDIKSLVVKDHVFDVSDLIAHLAVPVFAKIILVMDQRDEHHEDAGPSIAAAARTIASLAAPRASKPGQSFRCMHRATSDFEVAILTPENEGGNESELFLADFAWKAFNARVERATAYLALLSALPLHAAHELTLHSRFELSGASPQDWTGPLGLLPNVEVVNVFGFTAYGFVHVLRMEGALPRLRKLNAYHVHFTSPTRDRGFGTALARRLRDRPLESLEMKQCQVAEEQVDTFRGFCGEIKREGSANTLGAVGTSAAAMGPDDFDDEGS